jgi:hypothetical protein
MFLKPTGRRVPALLLAALLPAALGCGAPAMDGGTWLGKQAILDQVNIHLNRQDCVDAVSLIKPVYNSASTDNDVRKMMAASYACWANLNVLGFMEKITANAALQTGWTFFQFLAEQFPSNSANPNDRAAEGAELAVDALMAMLKPGAVILPSGMIGVGGYNPGSLNYTDRTDDSNLYLFFVSLAGVGALENRYGKPRSDWEYKKTTDLPWTTGDLVDADGCAFASLLTSFVDSMSSASVTLSGDVSTVMANLKTAFSDGINTACATGCGLCAANGVSCSSCPAALRNRSGCAQSTSDAASCAAAGIVTFINASWDTGP